MCPPIEQELSSRQLDGNLERGVEIWFENINLKVSGMHITFKCQEIGSQIRREEREDSGGKQPVKGG